MELLAPSLELLVPMEWSAFFPPYFNNDHTQANCGAFTLPTLININEEKRLLGPLGERLGRCWAKFSFVSNTQTCQYSIPWAPKGRVRQGQGCGDPTESQAWMPADQLLGRIGVHPVEPGGAISLFWVCLISLCFQLSFRGSLFLPPLYLLFSYLNLSSLHTSFPFFNTLHPQLPSSHFFFCLASIMADKLWAP